MVFTVLDIEELRPLITEGQERGFLTVERIAGALDDVEITKEQVAELHQYLDEQGVDILGAVPPRAGASPASRAPSPRRRSRRRAGPRST